MAFQLTTETSIDAMYVDGLLKTIFKFHFHI